MGIGRRTLHAAGWQTEIGLVRLAVGFVRFIVLARLLPIEVFGQFGLAAAAVGLSIVLPRFGLTAAFLHRAPETRTEEPAASVLFTVRFALTLGWAVCVAAAAVFFADGPVRLAVGVLVATQLVAEPAFVPRLLLVRRLELRRIALQETLAEVIGSAVAITLAMTGAGLFALLAPKLCHAILEIAVYYGVRPVWRPRFAVDRDIARYLLAFGARNLMLTVFDTVVEKLPELWTGLVLGAGPLGLYTRAARLTTYPRRVTTDPLVNVLPARFSELKDEPARFAAVLRSSAAILLAGAGLLAAASWIVAPWLVEHLLGPRWLPAVPPFRVLAVLIVLEPLRLTLTAALVARGEPGTAARIRGVQALVLAPGVAIGAASAGLAGVAASVSISAALCVVLLSIVLRRELAPASAGSAVRP